MTARNSSSSPYMSLWNDADHTAWVDKTPAVPELGSLVYASRLLAQHPRMVSHGGGNTSVKAQTADRFGELRDILYVKGSGFDLASIPPEGFTPLRLDETARLADLETLGDSAMADELMCLRTRASAPSPSVEAILHALLPFKFILHTHAASVVTLTNTRDGTQRMAGLYGDRVLTVPYVMPGFKLARLVKLLWDQSGRPDLDGMILLNHGVFTWGDSAQQAYDRMLEIVRAADDILQRAAPAHSGKEGRAIPKADLAVRAALRLELSDLAGAPLILHQSTDRAAFDFCQRVNLSEVATRGPLTPDHVIRTKRIPLVGRDVAGYADAYRSYFERNANRSEAPLTMLDPAPRVILNHEDGLLTCGRTVGDALAAAEITVDTLKAIQAAETLGGWLPVAEADAFDVEYWELEQAKLKRQPAPREFTGEIALVTGVAHGIGRAVAQDLLSRGACVVGLDLNPDVSEVSSNAAYLGLVCDITDSKQIKKALNAVAQKFGGIDMLILNAGIFPASQKISTLRQSDLARVMDINFEANVRIMRLVLPALQNAPRGGRVVVIASKNVPAPGPGAAAYSASKAALTQLARVAALEWGEHRIRVNVVHPNQVFDTALWTDEIIAERAEKYGLSVEAYRTNNVLKTEITSADVAQAVSALCSVQFSKTTGAQIPVDGGNDRVI